MVLFVPLIFGMKNKKISTPNSERVSKIVTRVYHAKNGGLLPKLRDNHYYSVGVEQLVYVVFRKSTNQ